MRTRGVAIALMLALVGTPALAQQASAWRPAWIAAPAPPRFDGPPEAPLGYLDQTIRQDIRLGVAADVVRLRISNEVGLEPLALDTVTATGPDGVVRPVTFSGARDIALPIGVALLSDPLPIAVERGGMLSVSLHAPGPTRGVVRRVPVRLGEGVAPVAADALLVRRQSFVSAVYALSEDAPRVVVALGDSITEGATATLGAEADWPSVLGRRLEAACPGGFVVVNAGISGNQVVRDGRSANVRARLDRDVLSLPGVTHVILIEGINDIRHDGNPANVGRSADEVIAAYRQVISRLHLHGIKVIGGTMTAFGGSERFDARSEATRQAVNTFIRESGAFDAVADFDAATRDPAQTDQMQVDLVGADRLHPNDKGYDTMAQAIDLDAFAPSGTGCHGDLDR
ncbi:SGNH/GDSL hydrolase family protein [Brevundimonas subvibrioides]|uniref:Lipolytic protein G-D-S-L family n=1 Tax=Brevundimonas subvibrioides (strain ATCC 15264 / DSM 4735 / LMG 14903 / NBRC 16000 / CB 81) TaxID=633149 RepID=D9QNG5_BRESC|nr:SGNH/GDSL hydrolase family protein [Brevundimonas subvibrioides]ADL02200.1 lipolytic protein G-D-S-L family [Brevundimonas subvibrioides ATCC 15264]